MSTYLRSARRSVALLRDACLGPDAPVTLRDMRVVSAGLMLAGAIALAVGCASGSGLRANVVPPGAEFWCYENNLEPEHAERGASVCTRTHEHCQSAVVESPMKTSACADRPTAFCLTYAETEKAPTFKGAFLEMGYIGRCLRTMGDCKALAQALLALPPHNLDHDSISDCQQVR